MTIEQLRRRARKHGMTIHKNKHYAADLYNLVVVNGKYLAAPEAMTLEQVEAWLDDLDKQEAE